MTEKTERLTADRLHEIMSESELAQWEQSADYATVKQATLDGRAWMVRRCSHGFEVRIDDQDANAA